MNEVHQKLPVVHILSVHLPCVKNAIKCHKSIFLIIDNQQ